MVFKLMKNERMVTTSDVRLKRALIDFGFVIVSYSILKGGRI
jgi:hypothetical protein